MNREKRAERIHIKYRQVPRYYCPTCQLEYDASKLVDMRVIRFVCNCGQELIIND